LYEKLVPVTLPPVDVPQGDRRKKTQFATADDTDKKMSDANNHIKLDEGEKQGGLLVIVRFVVCCCFRIRSL
jgi:hypothetical protein